MAKDYTYYYQFLEPGRQYSPGVYRTRHPNSQLYILAHRVWRQGPRGGVKIPWEDWRIPLDQRYGGGYKTTNARAMKEFVAVKLMARDYQQ